MSRARAAALAVIAALVVAASLTSFAESYRGLWKWASEHGLHGIWGYGFPLQVDTFLAVGEASLFVALVDRWPARSRLAAWGVTLAGLAVSVAGNVGHVAGHQLTSRATAAVPPLAAAAALAVGLGILKRTARRQPRSIWGEPGLYPAELAPYPATPAALNGYAEQAAELFAADIEAGRVPGIRAIRSGLHVGQDKAGQVQAYLRSLTRTP